MRASEPEDARGSDPALHVGHWLSYEPLGSPPALSKETEHALANPSRAAASLAFLDLVATLGHHALEVLRVLDPDTAARHIR